MVLALGCTQWNSSVEPIQIPNVSSPLLNETEEIMEEEAVPNETLVQIESNITNATLNESEMQETNESEEIHGLLFGEERYLLLLDDIVLDASKPGGACAAIKIYELETSELVGQEEVCKESDITWVSPEGRTFRIRLLEIAPGYTQTAKWARFIVFG